MIVDYKKVFSAVALVAGVLIAIPASAANYILDDISCISTGLCTPCDLIQVGVNGTEMILGLSGVAILLIFIYGGLLWMISYGDSKKVEKGSSAIRAAAIGMVIVFVSYSAVELLWQALRGNNTFSSSVQCSPLNIQSGGYLGNSETGGGLGAGAAPAAGTTGADGGAAPAAGTTGADGGAAPAAGTTGADGGADQEEPFSSEEIDYGCELCNEHKIPCCSGHILECDQTYACENY